MVVLGLQSWNRVWKVEAARDIVRLGSNLEGKSSVGVRDRLIATVIPSTAALDELMTLWLVNPLLAAIEEKKTTEEGVSFPCFSSDFWAA